MTEHATLSGGTVLRDCSCGSLGLTGRPARYGLLRLAARHLDEAVLMQDKTTLDGADLSALRTVVDAVARLGS